MRVSVPNWQALRAHLVGAIAGASLVGLIAAALALYAPAKTLLSFTGVTGGASVGLQPGHAAVLAPAPDVPSKGRHRFHPKARPPAAPQVPILEAARPKDAEKLGKKLGVDLKNDYDLVASGKLPDGRETYTVAPKDGGPAKVIAYEPRFHLGGRVALEGDLLTDLRGKVIAGQLALPADLVRIGRLQLSAGPALLYDAINGTRGAVLARASLCLVHC